MNDRITVRMSPRMLAVIDDYIAKQSDHISRQEVVRRCIAIVLPKSSPAMTFGDAQVDDTSTSQVVYLDT